AELDRATNGAFLIGGGALGHQPADRAAAKAEQRYVETGPAELSSFPRRLLRSLPRPIRSPARPACQLSERRDPAETRLRENSEADMADADAALIEDLVAANRILY